MEQQLGVVLWCISFHFFISLFVINFFYLLFEANQLKSQTGSGTPLRKTLRPDTLWLPDSLLVV
jgi:hypothetical protein